MQVDLICALTVRISGYQGSITTQVFSVNTFLCPRLPKAGVGYIAFRRDVTSVRAYVTFITRVITWVPFMLGSWKLVYCLPIPKFSTLC